MMKTMKAVVFKGKDRIALEEVPKPSPRAGEASRKPSISSATNEMVS